MSKIPSILEQELSSLKPHDLEADFLDRLVSCAEGTDALFSVKDDEFAKDLRAMEPKSLSARDHTHLLEKIGDTPFHIDEKIVLFNQPNKNSGKGKRSNIIRFNLAAAAAVALLGSLAALIIPQAGSGNGDAGIAANDGQIFEAPAVAAPAVVASKFSPVGVNRNLRETSDQGVIWRDQVQPHRVMRMIYTDHVRLSNDRGETINVDLPRVEYVILPEKVD